MRKIVIGMDAGMAGTDAWEFYEVPDDVTDEELSDFAWQCGKDHAEMYGIYPCTNIPTKKLMKIQNLTATISKVGGKNTIQLNMMVILRPELLCGINTNGQYIFCKRSSFWPC